MKKIVFAAGILVALSSQASIVNYFTSNQNAIEVLDKDKKKKKKKECSAEKKGCCEAEKKNCDTKKEEQPKP
ncbi:MAG: lipoprotein [Cytophagaceae bacterium]|jgi:hypothetical protein|nr:lipoprotein [Cytophagaceae bacterium]